jgi:diguanylate cyclase (GGDEF)-like protein
MNEQDRLAALFELDLLDTAEEKEFDDLVCLASAICGTPISTVTLIDKDRQWFKAAIGLTDRETHRNVSFCSHAIEQTGLFLVEDATADHRFSGNALVTGTPHFRFYAGIPIHAPCGAAIGTLCVIDTVPRQLTTDQKEALRILSEQVQARIDLRLKQKALIQKQAELELIAATDFLTGVSTRRVFSSRAEAEFAHWKRHRSPFSILLMDIDNFKQRNDRHGHAAGDEALILIGQVLKACLRVSDLAARMGGEEFGVLLPHTDLHGAVDFAARFRRALQNVEHGPLPLTASLGVASATSDCASWEQLLSHADEAMYIAKRSGKDRAEAFGLLPAARELATPAL